MIKYVRFVRDLWHHFQHPLDVEAARRTVRSRLARREANFLQTVERGIYNFPGSPYLPLLHRAGCEWGDVRRLVRREGVDHTLRALYDAGVFVPFEAFKGRRPLRVGGREIPVGPANFNNPLLGAHFHGQSGGSTGAPTPVSINLKNLSAFAPYDLLMFDAHGIRGAPCAFWRGVLPDGSGIGNILRSARFGDVPDRWFSPLVGRELTQPNARRFRATTWGIVALSRLMGQPIPWPEHLGLDEGIVIARWAAETLKRHGRCLIRATIGRSLRVCLAAQDAGLRLDGAVFLGGGESPTPAKVREIERAGARWVSNYSFSEGGRVGVGCARPLDGSDVHLLKDAFGLIQHPVAAPGTDVLVDSFHITSLLPVTRKILLNVQIDDYGVVERRDCGCPLGALGLDVHLRQIRSAHKLTGEGVCLAGTDVVRVLEEVLPTRFGGSALDYQLVQEEDERGRTRLTLRVHPRVALADGQAVLDEIVRSLRQQGAIDDMVRAIWRQGETLRLERREPAWTARGKFNPLHLVSMRTPPEEAG